jgi:adenylate cyclase
MVVTHALHRPQPGSPSEVHCSAAAKHTAATDRPDPGGPVISHACVMECVLAAVSDEL